MNLISVVVNLIVKTETSAMLIQLDCVIIASCSVSCCLRGWCRCGSGMLNLF